MTRGRCKTWPKAKQNIQDIELKTPRARAAWGRTDADDQNAEIEVRIFRPVYGANVGLVEYDQAARAFQDVVNAIEKAVTRTLPTEWTFEIVLN